MAGAPTTGSSEKISQAANRTASGAYSKRPKAYPATGDRVDNSPLVHKFAALMARIGMEEGRLDALRRA